LRYLFLVYLLNLMQIEEVFLSCGCYARQTEKIEFDEFHASK
jgi:hypothetical protein